MCGGMGAGGNVGTLYFLPDFSVNLQLTINVNEVC